MHDEVDPEEFQRLATQLHDLSVELSAHKALILALMSELPTEKLTEFSRFRAVAHSELDKYSPQSDEDFFFRNKMNEYLKRAIFESKKSPAL